MSGEGASPGDLLLISEPLAFLKGPEGATPDPNLLIPDLKSLPRADR